MQSGSQKKETLFKVVLFSREANETETKNFEKNFRIYLEVKLKALTFAPAFTTKAKKKKRSLIELHKQYK